MLGLLPRALLVVASLALGFSARSAGAVEPPLLPVSTQPPAIPPPDPITFDVAPRVGFSYRLGSSPSFPVDGRVGGVVGLGVAIAPWSRAAIGLGWEHGGVGSEHGQGDVADVRVRRSTDVIWASLRLYIVRTERFGFLVQLGPGLAIQHADADILVYPGAGMQVSTSRCRESAGPGLALRAGLGVEARIAGPLWFTADAGADNLHLTSDPLGDCTTGAGSLGLLGMRFGLTFRADVTRWLR